MLDQHVSLYWGLHQPGHLLRLNKEKPDAQQQHIHIGCRLVHAALAEHLCN
jgi:hypothetical protein